MEKEKTGFPDRRLVPQYIYAPREVPFFGRLKKYMGAPVFTQHLFNSGNGKVIARLVHPFFFNSQPAVYLGLFVGSEGYLQQVIISLRRGVHTVFQPGETKKI